jgi:hypothetical protein
MAEQCQANKRPKLETNCSPIDQAMRLALRTQFMQARAKAQADAEGFQDILFAVERLGFLLTRSYRLKGEHGRLNDFAPCIEQFVAVADVAPDNRDWHIPFAELFKIVRHARNDALHQGAFARHLASHAITLALIIEEALLDIVQLVVEHYMVRDPVCALAAQPLSFIRQVMLANSFSYLPAYLEVDGTSSWYLIADYDLARYVGNESGRSRRKRLAQTVTEAMQPAGSDAAGTPRKLEPLRANHYEPGTPIDKALARADGQPVLIYWDKQPDILLGILTPFDAL